MNLNLENIILESGYSLNKDIILIAGESGLSRIVSDIYFLEDVEFISNIVGRELIFYLDGSILTDDSLESLVYKSFVNGASGLLVSSKNIKLSISRNIITYCNENNFPLFYINKGLPMGKIMKDFSETIYILEEKTELMSKELERLLFSSPNNKKEYKSLLRNYSIDDESIFVVSYIDFKDSNYDFILYQDYWVKSVSKALKNRASNSHLLIGTQGLILTFLNTSRTVINKVSREIYSILKEKDNNIYIGIGGEKKGFKNFYISYKEAQEVVDKNKSIGYKEDTLINHSEIGLASLLLEVGNIELLRKYYESVLGPLLKYDRLNNTDLTYVLKVYLRNDCSVKETSEELYVHRNTINYKIRKSKDILDYLEFDALNKTRLNLAFIIEKLI